MYRTCPGTADKQAQQVTVSIIILTWNFEQHIGACLASLDQGLSAYSSEVIVIDNGSRDHTCSIVREARPGVETYLRTRLLFLETWLFVVTQTVVRTACPNQTIQPTPEAMILNKIDSIFQYEMSLKGGWLEKTEENSNDYYKRLLLLDLRILIV